MILEISGESSPFTEKGLERDVKKKSRTGRGEATSTAPGRKPVIAHNSEQKAKVNIEKKQALLAKELAMASRGDLSLQYIGHLPGSLRKFNIWEPVDGDGERLLRNSRETLMRYPDLVVSISQAIAALKKIRNTPIEKPSREQTLAAARRTGSLNQAMREIAERELVRTRSLLLSAKRALEVAEAKLVSLTRESTRLREEDRREIDDLRAENAKLLRMYGKIVPLKNK